MSPTEASTNAAVFNPRVMTSIRNPVWALDSRTEETKSSAMFSAQERPEMKPFHSWKPMCPPRLVVTVIMFLFSFTSFQSTQSEYETIVSSLA